MADTAGVTSNDDAPKPPAEPARKPLNSSWLFTVGGAAIGAYFLISGAFMIRDKHGDGIFTVLMAVIAVLVTVIAVFMFRTYRAERAARK